MAILITGGAGFIGSHLVEHLLAATDVPVVVLDNFNDYYDPRLKRATAAAWAGNPRLTLIEGDYGDSDMAEQVLLAHAVRAICHASSPSPRSSSALQKNHWCAIHTVPFQ